MNTQLEQQLADYFEDLASVGDPIAQPAATTETGPRRSPGAWAAVAAAAIVVLVLGPVAYLLGARNPDVGPGAPPATTTTTPEPATTTAGAAPVSGDGPLVFEVVPAPEVDLEGPGAWFKGRLFVQTTEDGLLSTPDGVTWYEEELQFVRDGVDIGDLAAGNGWLVMQAASPSGDGSTYCSIEIVVLGQQTTYVASLPYDPESPLPECPRLVPSDLAVGPAGVVVTAGIGERPIAWWSDDAFQWSLMDPTAPPMLDHQVVVQPTADGFLITSDLDRSAHFTGPSTWEEAQTVDPLERLGPVDVVNDKGTIRLASDPGQVLIPESATDGMYLYFGPMGLFGAGNGGMRYDVPADEILFSADGSTYARWTPAAFAGRDGLSFVGIGDDFLILADRERGELLVGRIPPQ